MPETTRLIGVYDARGSLLGEVAYLWGKVRGTRHCGLCDITHSQIRRRPEWDRLVTRLGVPMDLVHLDELPNDVADAVAVHGAPAVFARTSEGLQPVVLPAQFDGLGGSVDRLGDLLRAHLSGRPA